MSVLHNYYPIALQKELACIASSLMADGKAIMTSDESSKTLITRLNDIGVVGHNDTINEFREILIGCCERYVDKISGFLMCPDTFHRKNPNNVLFVETLKKNCILTGVRADGGVVKIFGSEGEELATQGLDNLQTRCSIFKRDGADFVKWRCVFKVGHHIPSAHAINDNANTLARFASIAQTHRLVPVIQPEILLEGHFTLDATQKISEVVLAAVFKALHDHHVYLEGLILKTNVLRNARNNKSKHHALELAATTLTVLQRTVPCVVAGIVLLFSGFEEEQCVDVLAGLAKNDGVKPWKITYSFSRVLQNNVLQTWKGKTENIEKARSFLLNGLAHIHDAHMGNIDVL